VAEVLNVIGDVEGKTAVLVDDMIDTGGISEGARLLRQRSASCMPARLMWYSRHRRVSGCRRTVCLRR